MRCGCPNCGTYMIQAERGLGSGCVCPACGNICKDCMGSTQGPMTKAELKSLKFADKYDEMTPEGYRIDEYDY